MLYHCQDAHAIVRLLRDEDLLLTGVDDDSLLLIIQGELDCRSEWATPQSKIPFAIDKFLNERGKQMALQFSERERQRYAPWYDRIVVVAWVWFTFAWLVAALERFRPSLGAPFLFSGMLLGILSVLACSLILFTRVAQWATWREHVRHAFFLGIGGVIVCWYLLARIDPFPLSLPPSRIAHTP